MACLNFTLYLNSKFPRNLWRNDIQNLTKLCQEFNVEHYSIEIVHLAAEPRRGFHDGVFKTPTILVEQENGRRQIVGNLGETERFLSLLQLSHLAEEMKNSPAVAKSEPESAGKFAELFLGATPFRGAVAR